MKIPLLFYPLTVICIDDNELVLNTLKTYLGNQYKLITYNSPNQALQDIQKNQDNKIIEKHLKKIINNEENDSNELQLNVKIAHFSELSKCEKKSNEIGVIISDYQMPELDGIEFFKKISTESIKKVLLTEHEDYQTVMSAFNANTIDLFLLKTADNLNNDLLANLKRLSREYFAEQTKYLQSVIETESKLPISDEKFQDFFVNLLDSMNIIEYYLVDIRGSFLLINAKNERYYLAVHTDKSLNQFAKLYNEPECKIFVDQIIKRQKIPFFGEVDPTDIDLDEWGQYMHTPKILMGDNKYYWHILKEELLNV